MDQYFGTEVNQILDASYAALLKSQHRKFNYAEIGYFDLWWARQNATTQAQFKSLLKSGQFNFVNGGWCQNDEANPYYDDIINQHTLGHLWLRSVFGNATAAPRVGWQADPFGHSSTHSYLLYLMGFDTVVTGRIGGRDLQRGNYLWSPGPRSAILNHVHGTYSELSNGACLLRRPGAPLDSNATFVQFAKDASADFNSSVVLATVGSDFCWGDADASFQYYDSVLEHFQAHPELGVTAQYSSYDDFVNDLYGLNASYHTIDSNTDQFPYLDGSGSWTGYFVTRPHFKRQVRAHSVLFHSANKYLASAVELKKLGRGQTAAASQKMNQLWKAMVKLPTLLTTL